MTGLCLHFKCHPVFRYGSFEMPGVAIGAILFCLGAASSASSNHEIVRQEAAPTIACFGIDRLSWVLRPSQGYHSSDFFLNAYHGYYPARIESQALMKVRTGKFTRIETGAAFEFSRDLGDQVWNRIHWNNATVMRGQIDFVWNLRSINRLRANPHINGAELRADVRMTRTRFRRHVIGTWIRRPISDLQAGISAWLDYRDLDPGPSILAFPEWFGWKGTLGGSIGYARTNALLPGHIGFSRLRSRLRHT